LSYASNPHHIYRKILDLKKS